MIPRAVRVQIQKSTEVANSVGEMVQTWQTVDTIWAEINPLRGREQVVMAQTKPTVDLKLTIRRNATTVTPKYRIVYGARIFDIESIIDRDLAFTDLFCKEQAA